MAVTAERFNEGMTYDEYKAQMTRNKERFEANERRAELDPASVETFQNLPQPLNVLVIAEDWCGDVIANVPVLGRLAAETDKLNVRIFLRDQNLDLMDQYLNKGEFRSIPVFAVFDQDFNEVGAMLERPESVTAELDRRRRAIFDANADFPPFGTPPDQMSEEIRGRLMAAMGQMRDEMREFTDREVVRELQSIAGRAA